MLPRGFDPETLKEHEKNEEIVDAERCLNGIAGDELQSALTALRDPYPPGKHRRRENKNSGPEPRRGLCLRCLTTSRRQKSIDGEQQNHGYVESDPPCPRCTGDHRLAI